ncbi:MAG: phosphatase PAP2 family protein [Anaerolineae bacterium]
MSIDWALFKFANGLAGHSLVLDTVIQMLMNDYALTTAIVLLLFALWFSGNTLEARERNQRAVLSAIAAVLLANLIVKACNLLFYRPRPFAYHEVTLLFYHPSDSSFPSNAATVGFCFAASIWGFDRKAGLLLYVLACLLGFARVCGGVHYPSDILGGLLVGTASAWLIAKKFGFLDRLWTIIIHQLRRLLLA